MVVRWVYVPSSLFLGKNGLTKKSEEKHFLGIVHVYNNAFVAFCLVASKMNSLCTCTECKCKEIDNKKIVIYQTRCENIHEDEVSAIQKVI